MKKVILLVLFSFIGIILISAQEEGKQKLSPEDFKKKQAAFLTEKAELTTEEAARFLPVYFELQDKKRNINRGAWAEVKRARSEKLSEAQYESLITRLIDARISSDKLEKAYLSRFKNILSCEKIFKVQAAEMRFHRDMLKEFGRKGGCPRD